MGEWNLTPDGHWVYDPTAVAPQPDPESATAGEQDHSNPWRYAGDLADPPKDPE